MKSYFFCFSLVLFSYNVFGQQAALDSLSQLTSTLLEDSSKVSTLIQLGFLQVEEDASAARAHALDAKRLSTNLNFPRGIGNSLMLEAETYFAQREVERSLGIIESAIAIFDREGLVTEQMDAIERKVQILYNASSYDRAIEALYVLVDHFTQQADTSEWINNLGRLSICYEEKGEYQQSIDKAEEAYRLSILSDDKEGAAINLSNKAMVYRAWGKNMEALETFEEALVVAKEIDHKLMEGVFVQNTGIMHSRMGNFTQSLEAFFKALDIFKKLEENERASDILHNIGLIYKKNGEYEKAIAYYEQSLENDLARADSSGMKESQYNLGNAHLLLKNYEAAKYHLTAAYQIAHNNGGQCLNGEAAALGDYYMNTGQLDSAQYFLNQEMTSIEECGNQAPLARTTYFLGQINTQLRKGNLALSYFKRSLKAAQDGESLEETRDASKALYDWYNGKNAREALRYLTLFQKTNDTLFNQENTRKLAWMEANYQLKNVTDSLNRQQEEEAMLFARQMEAQKTRQQLILIISIGVILCLIFYYLYVRKQRQFKHEQALAEEKSKGFNAVLTATEEERKRIAKDLHDGVVQQMGAVQLALSQIIPRLSTEEAQEAEKIKQMTAAAATETRELSHQMMPKVLIEMGLLPAMKEVIDRSLVLDKVEVSFENFGLQERYANSIEIAIYRIFQELINNIVKHAGATEVSIQLLENGRKLILIVEDNGQGMQQQASEGIGLQNIKSRLSTIDGKVDYSSGPASGTVATVVIPI